MGCNYYIGEPTPRTTPSGLRFGLPSYLDLAAGVSVPTVGEWIGALLLCRTLQRVFGELRVKCGWSIVDG